MAWSDDEEGEANKQFSTGITQDIDAFAIEEEEKNPPTKSKLSAREWDKGKKREREEKKEEDTPPMMTRRQSKAPDPPKTTPFTISGIIGTDENGYTFIPPACLFGFDPKNATHKKLVDERVKDDLATWNALAGCSARSFSVSADDWTDGAPSVVGGLTRNFTAKKFPEGKSERVAKKSKKK